MNTPTPAKATKAQWAGRALSALIAVPFVMSAGMKLAHAPEVVAGMAKFGYSESVILPLGVVEIACLITYLIPASSILGAILLTGYLGGAINTHLRVGEAFVMQVIIGVLVWGGLYLRDERLRSLIPLRTKN